MMFLKTIKYSLISWLVGLPLFPQATSLSLAEAVSRTLAQNRDVLSAKLAVQVKENETLAAKTRRWPSLTTSGQVGPLLNRPTLTFTQGTLGSFPSTGPIPATNRDISIPRKISGYGISQASVPLTQQWRLGLNVKAAREDEEVARAQASEVRGAAVGRVRSLYFQIAALDSAQKVAKAQLEAAEEVSRLARDGVAQGTALRADETRADARLAQAKADSANIAADLQDGIEQLNLLMGDTLDAQFVVTTDQREEFSLTQEEARQRAVENRPELKEGKIRLDQANLSVRSKRLEQIPDLNFVVSDLYFLNTSNYLPNQIASAGLSLSWEPWDWGRKQHEAAALKAKEEQQRLAVAQMEQQVKFEADRAWREYERSNRTWQASQLATRSAEEQLRVVKERYTRQAALLRDLLEAQTNWEAAGQTEARDLAAVGTAWANLQTAIGNDERSNDSEANSNFRNPGGSNAAEHVLRR